MMACWITDGSDRFTINGNVVTHVDYAYVDNVFNAMWQDGVSSGEHYWKIHFPILESGAGVGLSLKDHFKQGYTCETIKYMGNLSNDSGLLVSSMISQVLRSMMYTRSEISRGRVPEST